MLHRIGNGSDGSEFSVLFCQPCSRIVSSDELDPPGAVCATAASA